MDTLEDVPALEYITETSSVESTEHSSVTRSPETPECSPSPVTQSPETPEHGTRSPETPERSPVTQSPETRRAGRSLDYATPHRFSTEFSFSTESEMHSSEAITPQSEPSVDRILVCDNPTFQSQLDSTPTSPKPDDINPYQVHRHNVFRIRAGRHLPCLLQLLERLGI